MDRKVLARAKVAGARQFALAAKEAGPPCRFCVFQMGDRVRGDRCSNPAFSDMQFDPSTGAFGESYKVKTKDARSEMGLCGAEALLFETKCNSLLRAIKVKDATLNSLAVLFLAFMVFSVIFL